MKNTYLKSGKNKTKRQVNCFMFFLLLLSCVAFAQESKSVGYRTIEAYLNDFAKNELFVKKSLQEYSASIMDNQMETRSRATANKIIDKLKSINTILKINDKGFEKNTFLRDSFIRMNEKTIECMANGTLIMNDYINQSSYPVSQIIENLNRREDNLNSYFYELRRYEKSKRDFGMQYHVIIKTFSGNNIFEYNAYENILFYKINVINAKINASINQISCNDFTEAMSALDAIYEETNTKTSAYKDNYADVSLNNATLSYCNFIYNQKNKITSLFDSFMDEYTKLQKLKSEPNQNTEAFLSQYNSVVKSYNQKKKELFDVVEIIQKDKETFYTNWQVVNRAFLKNNAKFENLYDSYTYVD